MILSRLAQVKKSYDQKDYNQEKPYFGSQGPN